MHQPRIPVGDSDAAVLLLTRRRHVRSEVRRQLSAPAPGAGRWHPRVRLAGPGDQAGPVALVDALELFAGRRFQPLPPLDPAPGGIVVVGFREDVDVLLAAASTAAPFSILDHLAPGALAEMVAGPAPPESPYWPRARRCAERIERLEAEACHPDSLTPREGQVLGLVCRGLRNEAIAHVLDLAEKTVANYLTNVYHKTGLRGRYDAIVRYGGGGGAQPPQPG